MIHREAIGGDISNFESLDN